MKNDLISSIAIAIFGIVAAYLICNLFVGEAKPYSFFTVDDSASSTELANPDIELFNYKALNPTVEVYVGDCRNYDEYGECVDESAEQIEEGVIEEESEEEQEEE